MNFIRGQERSRTQKRGGGFRAAFIRAFTMTYRLTGHLCNNKWIAAAPEEMGPAQETAEFISQLRRRNWSALNQRHTTKYQYARHSITRALPQGKGHSKGLHSTYYLKETSIL